MSRNVFRCGALAISLSLAMTSFALAATTTPQGGNVSETAEGAAVAQFTAETVDPADPFGDIDVTRAGATEAEAKAFFDALPSEQQTELKGRCAVILSPVHQQRYAEETSSLLCRNLLGAGLIDEADLSNASTGTPPAN